MLLYPTISNEFLGSSAIVRAVVFAVAKTYEDNDLRVAQSGRFVILRQHRIVHHIHDCLDIGQGLH